MLLVATTLISLRGSGLRIRLIEAGLAFQWTHDVLFSPLIAARSNVRRFMLVELSAQGLTVDAKIGLLVY